MCSEDVSEILVAWLGAVAGDICMFIFSTILYYIGYNNFKTVSTYLMTTGQCIRRHCLSIASLFLELLHASITPLYSFTAKALHRRSLSDVDWRWYKYPLFPC